MSKSVPEVRFKGFCEKFEEFQLGQLGTFKNGMNMEKEDLGKGFPFVNLQDIFGNNVVNASNLGLVNSSSNQREDYSLKTGDVLFIRSSVKPEGVGEAAVIEKSIPNATYSGFLIRFRAEKDIDNIFKRFIFSSSNIRNQIMKKATSSANTNINQDSLKLINVFLPELYEQQKIGSFFKQLDNTISLQQQLLDQQQQYKKAMLQKMYPQKGERVPKIRFEGFNGEWDEYKLGDISEKVTEKNKDNLYSETLTNSAEYGIINQRDFFEKDISNKKNLNGYYIVRPDDFVYNPRISNLAPVGPIKRNTLGRTGVMSPLYHVFRAHDVVNKSYLETYFSSNGWHEFMKLNGDSGARSDRFAIKDSVFREMPIPLPSAEEQQKIGSFFEQLNDRIALHQKKLEDYQKLKKALLQRMFV